MSLKLLYVGNFLDEGRPSVVPQACEELTARLGAMGHRVVRTSTRRSRFFRLADMLGTVMARKRDYELAIVDVFSGPSFFWAWAVGRCLNFFGKPFVYVLHGGALPEYAATRGRWVRRTLQMAAGVVAPSPYLAEKMAPYRLGIEVIPNGLAIGDYPFRLRQKANPRLVWLRAFHRIYDPALAPKVLKAIRESFPDARLLMVGPDKDGSLEEVCRTAEDLGVACAIEFRGRIPKTDVPGTLGQGDIFLNTTTIDNTPVSVVEAMACGLCVVSTDVGGLPYLLEDGENASLASTGDWQGMAKAVCRVLEDPVLAAGLSMNGRRTAEGFDWSVVMPRWGRLLESVTS